MQKLLLTDTALKRKMAFVLLHMIMHCILILLYGLAYTAYKLAGRILLIGICHWLTYDSLGFSYQFYADCNTLPSLLAMTIVPTWAIVFFTKARLLLATVAMGLLGSWHLSTGTRVDIERAELLPTAPTP
jgi:hypothetical protein